MDNSLAALAEKIGNGSPSHLQRLEFLVSTVPVAIYTCKADGDFGATFVSDGVRALWGYEPQEFLKDSRFWIDRLHPEDADRIIAGLGVLPAAGQYSHEYRFRTKSGEYRWVRDELHLLRGTAGEPLEIVGHCSDITERKGAEAALRESEARLALIFNSSSDTQILLRVEPGGRLITETVNRAFREKLNIRTGQDIGDFLGKDFEVLLAVMGNTPDEIEHRRAFYLRSIAQNATLRFDIPYSPAGGAIEVVVSPIVDRNGYCTHVLGSARDMTERRKAEAALRESEERYALVTEATLDGIFDWNLETGDSHLSLRFKEILGYTSDGHAGDELPSDCASVFARLHPEDLTWLNELVVRPHAGQALEMFEREVRFQRKDGTYCWVAARGQAVRNAAGLPIRFIGAIHDITERKRSEDTAAFLASIVQSSEDSIVGNGLDGIILSWNASSERFWGYTAGEVIGKHVKILFPPERVHEFECNLEKVHRDEPIKRFETVRVRKDGRLIAVSIILSPVKDPHGKLLGVAAIYRDITERKQAEDQLLAAKQAAEASAVSLRVSEERYALATQATYDGIFDWNLATGESYLSPRFKQILGYSPDELPNDLASFHRPGPSRRPRAGKWEDFR